MQAKTSKRIPKIFLDLEDGPLDNLPVSFGSIGGLLVQEEGPCLIHLGNTKSFQFPPGPG
jgi:hypothetical protein